MKAMIFAAGLGKRLGKITEKIPKALVEIDGKTALHIAVEKCSLHGFGEIIINVHHYADLIEKEVDHLNRSGFNISVSDERKELLDTGGGLFKAKKFFDKNPFLIYNVDIISDLNLTALYKYHLQKKGIATLAVRKRTGSRYYLIDSSGRIKGWRNKSTGEQVLTGSALEDLSEIAFSGMHIAEPEIFKFMNEGIYTMTDLYLRLSAKHNIFTFRDDGGFWVDIGTPESLETIRALLKNSSR
jgi:MurNAc alpha-1-phosphate uridylyltransferase